MQFQCYMSEKRKEENKRRDRNIHRKRKKISPEDSGRVVEGMPKMLVVFKVIMS